MERLLHSQRQKRHFFLFIFLHPNYPRDILGGVDVVLRVEAFLELSLTLLRFTVLMISANAECLSPVNSVYNAFSRLWRCEL